MSCDIKSFFVFSTVAFYAYLGAVQAEKMAQAFLLHATGHFRAFGTA
jgi:hypothetical protein